jgi:hypothetical protein
MKRNADPIGRLLIVPSIIAFIGILILASGFGTVTNTEINNKHTADIVAGVSFLAYVIGLCFFAGGVKGIVLVFLVGKKIKEAIFTMILSFLMILIAPLTEAKFLSVLKNNNNLFYWIKIAYLTFIICWAYSLYLVFKDIRDHIKGS